jgi:hypothetical protein
LSNSDFIAVIYELNRALSFYFNILYGKEPLHAKIVTKWDFAREDINWVLMFRRESDPCM